MNTIYKRGQREDPKNTFGRKERTMEEEEEGMGWNKGRRKKKAHFCSLSDYM